MIAGDAGKRVQPIHHQLPSPVEGSHHAIHLVLGAVDGRYAGKTVTAR